MIKTNWPHDSNKLYGHLKYHEWFYTFNDMKDLYETIVKLYQTKKWWDYDGFLVYKGNPDWKFGVDIPIDWRSQLNDEQLKELNRWEEYNFKMD